MKIGVSKMGILLVNPRGSLVGGRKHYPSMVELWPGREREESKYNIIFYPPPHPWPLHETELWPGKEREESKYDIMFYPPSPPGHNMKQNYGQGTRDRNQCIIITPPPMPPGHDMKQSYGQGARERNKSMLLSYTPHPRPLAMK